ncbi:5-methylcytosine-specific restriction endonuclease system specificity protein McrC [Yersinia enterocolitica]|uniref:5-methylcytosine-specific restriction endonuclease system specificity protein McrC n=1 Tax=Yersinia enterocolitica TaxID=630 RepID=UPI0005E4B23F|nr:5-methylcytosine-specific restriction endonuclease system specificity protein McrC [Yersinia enterocolitica]EKN3956388.1 5-methylcytosine-specific restriction endonuclease system specificity protein McrC [Yersinia enterocolitica]EKN3997025.1 5-methylcytosine-specific restriction endonuclease system specificity protein McrC [Yersinia enterocolitica]EKN4895136.1 5-methylcytosine-specific restriction endonuclease system specificity protein McrC [Yersinia enterocolitica]CQH35067.1 5-methylcytosi
MTTITGSEQHKASRIPVRNLWLLMLYASDLFRQLGRSHIAVEDNPTEIPDLVATILLHEIALRRRRNLSIGYQTRHAALNRVRGRIDVLYTASHQLLERGRVACHFQDMTLDNPRNRYVRCALERLLPIITKPSLAADCHIMAISLRREGINGGYPDNRELPSVRHLGRHDAADKPMVDAAQLAFELLMPTEDQGQHLLPAPSDNLYWMRRLFEKGIAGFYRVHLAKTTWRISAGKELKWALSDQSAGSAEIFPTMKSDIILEHKMAQQRIIIDTKFNAILTKGWHRDQSLRNGYIYQLYTYLRTQESKADPLSLNAAGLLLHPAVGYMLNEHVVTQGHKIHFATVDMAVDAKTIKRQLLDLAHDCAGVVADGLPLHKAVATI